MRLRLFKKTIYVLFALTLATAANAQITQRSDAVLEDVRVEFTNFKNVSDEAILAHIWLKPGQVYDSTLADQSVHSLYKSNLYDFISVRLDEGTDGKTVAIFEITSKYRISDIIFEGNKKLSTRNLVKEIESKVGTSLDEAQLKQDTNKLMAYYEKKGYPQANINYSIQKNPETGRTKVTFKIKEGPNVRIQKIIFEGYEPLSKNELVGLMKTKRWNFLSIFTGAGNFKEEDFYDDLERIRDYCKKQGYLDVQLTDDDVSFEYPNHNRLVIRINLKLGRLYHVGNIQISNNKLYSIEKLKSALKLKKGDVFSPEKIDENTELLRDLYGQVGYLETYAIAERIPNLETGAIDLNFIIYESEKFYVESINVQGNVKTKSKVIIREIALAPGDVFDLVQMKNSQSRLQNTRYFEEVSLLPEATKIPGRKNLCISVKETKTAAINFGGGFSNVERFIAYTEYSQSNFDLFNYRNWFQGGGQKFRVRFSIGSRSNAFLLYFEEPWCFERELAFGFEIFRNRSDFQSSAYNELRYGFEVFLRKHLFELVDGRLYYHWSTVNIFNVKADASNRIKAEEGNRSVSKVGFVVARDTRDNFVYPTEGNRAQISTELAGGPFGGQTKCFNVGARGAQWFQLFETGEQVFSIMGNTETITGYGGQSVPFFDRYYLGGPDDLRGFGFRKIGPVDNTGEPIGGKTLAYASAEYTVKLFDPVRLAGFYDIGFLNNGSFNWNPKQYRDNVGIGLRIFIMGAPLRLDLGYPITKSKVASSSPEFSFSVGARF